MTTPMPPAPATGPTTSARHRKPGRSTFNLAPLPHRQHRAVRRWQRLWAWVCLGYVVLAAGVSAAIWLVYVPGTGNAGAELAALRSRNHDTQAAIGRIAAQIASVRAKLDYRKSMIQQPDFAVLLQLLSDAVDRDTVIRHLSLKGSGVDVLRASPPPPGGEREPRHFLLTLRGSSRGETGVSRLSLRLRESGVFDHVELRRTGRDAGGDGDSVAFEIDCVLSDAQPAALPPAAASTPASAASTATARLPGGEP